MAVRRVSCGRSLCDTCDSSEDALLGDREVRKETAETKTQSQDKQNQTETNRIKQRQSMTESLVTVSPLRTEGGASWLVRAQERLLRKLGAEDFAAKHLKLCLAFNGGAWPQGHGVPKAAGTLASKRSYVGLESMRHCKFCGFDLHFLINQPPQQKPLHHDFLNVPTFAILYITVFTLHFISARLGRICLGWWQC